MTRNETELRDSLCTLARRVHAGGFVAGTDGNVSARLDDHRFLISASATSLGRLAADDLVVIDSNGDAVDGERRPSSERWMHLELYSQRPDVRAIVHAHPPTVIALTLAGVGLPARALPELIISFGEAPTAPYATPGTKDGAAAVRGLVATHDAIVLDRHGSLTFGATMDEAFDRLEQLEHAARVLATARALGPLRTLSDEEIRRLVELRNAYFQRGG